MARIKRLSALHGDQRGTSVVELAIIAPFLSLLTMGIVDLSNGYSRRLQLTEAVSRTLEKLAAQDFEVPADADLEDEEDEFEYLREDAAEAAGGGVTKEDVSVTKWLECDGVEQASFDSTCPPDASRPECEAANADPALGCLPVMARYIQIRIDTSYRPTFSSVVSPQADGTFPLSAEAAVRIQ